MAQHKDFTLDIPESVYQQIMHYVHKAKSYEVSGMGSVIYDKETKKMTVEKIFLAEQENTGSTTNMTAEAIADLEFEHHKAKLAGEVQGELRWWWHSHANMAVFWSTTDHTTMAQLGEHDWFVHSVFNAKEEVKTAVTVAEPMNLFVDDIDTTVIPDELGLTSDNLKEINEKFTAMMLADYNISIDMGFSINDFSCQASEEDVKLWDEAYDEKVKKRTYTATNWYGRSNSGNTYGRAGGYGGYYNNYYYGSTPAASAKDDPVGKNRQSYTEYLTDIDDDNSGKKKEVSEKNENTVKNKNITTSEVVDEILNDIEEMKAEIRLYMAYDMNEKDIIDETLMLDDDFAHFDRATMKAVYDMVLDEVTAIENNRVIDADVVEDLGPEIGDDPVNDIYNK